MKKHNPTIPIMLREAQGTLPKVYARFEFGNEKSQSLEGTHATPHGRLWKISGGYIQAMRLARKRHPVERLVTGRQQDS